MSARLNPRRAALLAAALVLPVLATAQDWPIEGPPGPLPGRRVALPAYQVKTLANGLQVVVVPHHEQPSVSFRLLVSAGALQEPADKPGVAGMVGSLLNQGTDTKSASEIATLIDSAGGVIGVAAGNELTSVYGAVLKDQTNLALGLAADIVQNASFPPDEIALHRKQALSSLQVGYDDPDYLASAVFDRLVFGMHPYGRPNDGTPASVAQITRADLTAFRQTWFVPNNSLLAIVGDVSMEEGFAAAERAFGAWQRRAVPPVSAQDPPAPRRRVVVIDRPGSAQTEIRVGQLAIPHTSPDYIPFDLAIRILGGEGANRLFGVLRSDRGLTYGASADLHAYKTSGVVEAETNTRTPTTGETLRLMFEEFVKLQRENVHPGELSGAQDFIRGHFPQSMETPAAMAEQVLTQLFYGQSPTEIETYLDRVSRVTPADIQRVARQWLRPEQLSIVLVGDAATFVNQLVAMGFSEYERIPLADLDLDSPTLRRQPSGRGASIPGRPPA